MINAQSPIAVIDSGVGGLTTVAQLSQLLPNENILYCGDNANAPYGNRTGTEIVTLTRQMLDFLTAQNVKMVAIACNTISSTLDTPGLAGYEKQYPFPVFSIIHSAANEVVKAQLQNVGVIATTFTVQSQCYPKLITELQSDINVFGEPSAHLAALIEQGDLASPAIAAEVSTHVSHLLTAHPEIAEIVLGCTHYPIVENLFQQKAPNITFVNPAEAQAHAVHAYLAGAGLLNDDTASALGALNIHTSGSQSLYATILDELQITRPFTFHATTFSSHKTTRTP